MYNLKPFKYGCLRKISGTPLEMKTSWRKELPFTRSLNCEGSVQSLVDILAVIHPCHATNQREHMYVFLSHLLMIVSSRNEGSIVVVDCKKSMGDVYFWDCHTTSGEWREPSDCSVKYWSQTWLSHRFLINDPPGYCAGTKSGIREQEKTRPRDSTLQFLTMEQSCWIKIWSCTQ